MSLREAQLIEIVNNPESREKLEQRFKAKFTQTSDKDCWNWLAYKDKNGYGELNVKGKALSAHRISWILEKGIIPEGLHIDHLCRNPACVNYNHMEPVTQKVNSLRGKGLPAINKRKTTCWRGHALNEDNVYLEIKRTSVMRHCIECCKIIKQAYKNKVQINRELNKKPKPTKETLEILLQKENWTDIGLMYGVSDNAVRKWAKNYCIVWTKRSYLKRSNSPGGDT